MPVDSHENQPSEQQSAIIGSPEISCAVIAAAGSGKTRVLVGRCLEIIARQDSDLERMLAITFTEKAAGEMKKRLRKNLPHLKHRIESAWIGTFHSCFARILRQSGTLIGLDPSFTILDENAARMTSYECARDELLRLLAEKNESAVQLVDLIDFKNTQNLLIDLLAFRWHANKWLNSLDDLCAEELEIAKPLAEVYKTIETALHHRFQRLCAIDFQELEILVLELFKKHPQTLEHYQKKFKHILVDEFQDTNDLQTEFVLGLFNNSLNRLCIVGDPRQSIYRFRGANVECFKKALDEIINNRGKKNDLQENYRSAKPIIDFINLAQSSLSDGLFASISSDGSGGQNDEMTAKSKDMGFAPQVVKLTVTASKENTSDEKRQIEAQSIASSICKMINEENIPPSNIAILFRALTNTSHYELAFKAAGIPYLVFGGRGFLERQEISDLTAILAYVSDQNNNPALLQILRSPLVGLSDDELIVMAGESGKELKRNVAKDPRCHLINEISRLAKYLNPSELLRETINLSGYEELCARLDPSGGMMANIDRFITMAESLEMQEPTTLTDFSLLIKTLRDRSARIGDPPSAADGSMAVKIMTVHAAKGLEFPVVILPELFREQRNRGGNFVFSRSFGLAFKTKNKLLPFSKRNETERYEQIAENEKIAEEAELKRLLYVAMTRAEKRLIIPICACEPKSNWPWHNWLLPCADKAVEDGLMNIWPDQISQSPENAFHPEATNRCHTEAKPKDLSFSTAEGRRYVNKSTGHTINTNSTTPPSVLTVTELECYSRCPKEYELKYLFKLQSDFNFDNVDDAKTETKIVDNGNRLPANVMGSIVHGVLEKYTGRKTELRARIESTCHSLGVLPNADTFEYVEDVIANFEEHRLFKYISSGERELRFNWKTNDVMVIGSIDWLIETNNGLEIVDFKTDSVPSGLISRKAEDYELQITCYALAVEAARGTKIASTSLLFLSAGEEDKKVVDDERRFSAKKNISDAISGIAGGKFEKREGKRCSFCPMRNYCTTLSS